MWKYLAKNLWFFFTALTLWHNLQLHFSSLRILELSHLFHCICRNGSADLLFSAQTLSKPQILENRTPRVVLSVVLCAVLTYQARGMHMVGG